MLEISQRTPGFPVSQLISRGPIGSPEGTGNGSALIRSGGGPELCKSCDKDPDGVFIDLAPQASQECNFLDAFSWKEQFPTLVPDQKFSRLGGRPWGWWGYWVT